MAGSDDPTPIPLRRRRRAVPRTSTPPFGATPRERRRNVAGLGGLAIVPALLEHLTPELAELVRDVGEGGLYVLLVLLVVEVVRVRAALERVADATEHHERTLETHAARLTRLETHGA